MLSIIIISHTQPQEDKRQKLYFLNKKIMNEKLHRNEYLFFYRVCQH